MADDMRKVGIQFVSEGAEQSTKNVESFDQANQDLAKTLDTLVQKQSAVGTSLEQVDKQIASIADTMSEMLNREIDLGFNDELFESLQTQHDALIEKSDRLAQQWTNLSAKIAGAKGELGQFNEVIETEKVTESVSKLTEGMRLVAQVAKEYGMSGAEASRQVKMGAEEAGESISEFSRKILAEAEMAKDGIAGFGAGFKELPRVINETTSELQGLLNKEDLIQVLENRIRAVTEETAKFGTASETAFAEIMQNTEAWNKYSTSVQAAEAALRQIQDKILAGARSGGPSSQTGPMADPANVPVSPQAVQAVQAYTVTAQQAQNATAGLAASIQQAAAQTQANTTATQQQAQAQQTATGATQQATQAQQQHTAAQTQAAQAANVLNQATMTQAQLVSTLGSEWQRAFMSFKQLGDTPQTALNEVAKAVQANVEPAELLKRNQDQLFQQMLSLSKAGKSWTEISKAMSEQAGELNGRFSRLSETSVRSSRAFFALTLASFGLMSVAQELKKSFGDDLPPAFEKASSAVQQIASFGSAGAFVGGPGGAILGGIVGGLVAVTTAAVTLSPELQQLNQQLDNMSNRDEVVETLSEIANVSEDVVEIWLEAARKDPSFADTLEEIVKKGQPVPGLLATIRAASKELTGDISGLERALGDAGDAVNKLLLLLATGATGWTVFAQNLLDGKTVIEAATKATESMNSVISGVEGAVKGAGIAEQDLASLTAQANAILAEQGQVFEKLEDAARDYADAVSNAGYREEQALNRAGSQIAQAQQQFNNSVADAAEQRNNSILQADRNLANRSADLWQQYQDTIIDTNQKMADKVFDIHQNLANKISDIQQQLGDRIFDIQQQLANRIQDIQIDLGESIFDINQDLENKLRDLANQRDQDVKKANQDIQDAAKELSRKLYEIERERLQSIEALAFSTHEQLQDARTSHDRDRILRRAQFEQSQIDQKANNERQDAQADFADKVAQAEEERRLAQDTFDYEVRLARFLADQKIQQAQRAAAIQMAQAQRDAGQQIEQAQRQSEQQIAIAQREAEQQLAIAAREQAQQLEIAQRRYAQELADARRTYVQQVEDARRAEAQKNADAQRSLQQRIDAIHKAYELERAEIKRTLELALAAYKLIIESIIQAMRGLTEFEKQYERILPDIQGPGPRSPDAPFTPLETTTPPTGERFGLGTVRPVSTSMNTRNNSINIVINDATDPLRVGTVVRRVLQDTLSGAA